MPYITPIVLDDVKFPGIQINPRDFDRIHDFLFEKWERFYPKLPYFTLDKPPTEVLDPTNAPNITGNVGKTRVDRLYGEDVEVGADGKWLQSHSQIDSASASAPSQRVFEDAVNIPIGVSIPPVTDERILSRFGIDRNRELTITIPVIILDRSNITVRRGDEIEWDGNKYEIMTPNRRGYWKFTNQILYIVADCKLQRHNS